MPINISISKRPNPKKPDDPWKYYAQAQYSDKMDIDTFSEHISSHNSKYGRADIAAVLTMAVDCMCEQFKLGNMIILGDLGSFEVAVSSIGVEKASDFKTDVNITDVHINWTPGARFTNLLPNTSFKIVPSRKSMRKIMKAIKAGELTVDLSDEDDSSDDSSTDSSSTDSSDSSSDSGSGSSSSSDSGGSDSGNSGDDSELI